MASFGVEVCVTGIPQCQLRCFHFCIIYCFVNAPLSVLLGDIQRVRGISLGQDQVLTRTERQQPWTKGNYTPRHVLPGKLLQILFPKPESPPRRNQQSTSDNSGFDALRHTSPQ